MAIVIKISQAINENRKWTWLQFKSFWHNIIMFSRREKEIVRAGKLDIWLKNISWRTEFHHNRSQQQKSSVTKAICGRWHQNKLSVFTTFNSETALAQRALFLDVRMTRTIQSPYCCILHISVSPEASLSSSNWGASEDWNKWRRSATGPQVPVDRGCGRSLSVRSLGCHRYPGGGREKMSQNGSW